MASTLEPAQSLAATDWTCERNYLPLLGADVSAFAWEWLRRKESYRSAFFSSALGQSTLPPQSFGLETYENPDLAVPTARPIWTADISADVLRAHVSDPFAPRRDRVDLRLLSPLVTVIVAEDEIEHLLLSDGQRSIRIDVIIGTLIGCPASLTYLLHGLSGLKGPMHALDRLSALVTTGRFLPPPSRSPERYRRWIMQLRVADALAGGHDQQTIARQLFAGAISSRRWRKESGSYRRRVQRLVAEAKANLVRPLDKWFTQSASSGQRS